LATIWLACALTLFTGAQYYFDGRRALHGGRREDRGRRRRTELLLARSPTQLDVARRADGRAGVDSHFHQAVGDNHTGSGALRTGWRAPTA